LTWVAAYLPRWFTCTDSRPQIQVLIGPGTE